jgi:hypothetical protein
LSQYLVLDNSNISIILNSKLGLLRDNIKLEIDYIDKLINSLINQTRSESTLRKERCEICDSKEDYFEGHHIAGRKHDFRQVTVCKPCHDELSRLQKIRDQRWTKYNQSEYLRESFFLNGLYDILILKSKKSSNFYYEKYAILLTEDIAKRLKSK